MTIPSSKIFGIGFQRTGTSSLVRALDLLGIKSIHNPVGLLDDVNHPVMQMFDGFADNPLPLIYRDLDARYPGSRFILTDRDVDTWLRSVRWLFTVAPTLGDWGRSPAAQSMHRALYGVTHFDEAIFRARYLRHRSDVLAYFAGRRDLLVIDFARGEGWDPLCRFLARPVPDEPFPHENGQLAPYSAAGLGWRLRNFLRKARRRSSRG